MSGKDERGRFTTGNEWAAIGGYARAAVLTPEKRREIAAAGFAGLVERRFAGDRDAARRYLGDLGAWASDQAYAGTSIAKPEAFGRPELPF